MGSFPFPQVRGKTVTDVYVTANNEINCVTVSFDDDTELVIDVDPCFAVRFTAGYSDWKSGNQRVIKSWPRIRT
ncbi:MAG: hypothetical protein LAO20_12980 [Acidobacteriia bacterium]|nr:hypothetical protein [Terriglobia bacterium]